MGISQCYQLFESEYSCTVTETGETWLEGLFGHMFHLKEEELRMENTEDTNDTAKCGVPFLKVCDII